MAEEGTPLSEETDPEIAQLNYELPLLPPDLVEDFQEFKRWWDSTGEKEFIEYSAENSQKVSEMDPRFVATDHDTCDSPQVSTGFYDFGPNPRCCWVTHGWYISKKEWEPEDLIKSGAYDICSKCNLGGDEDGGDPDCDLCYGDGWTNYYFDDYV